MKTRLFTILFPPKCVLCKKVLTGEETDLCRNCRETLPEYPQSKIKLSFLAQWTGVWYYKENVRLSILRYKFYGHRSYAAVYGRFLAMKLMKEGWDDTDVLSYIPISRRRKRQRGYDQAELLAEAVAEELGVPLVPTLRKIRHTSPQSTMGDASHRRANVLGAYEVIDPALVRDRSVLILDDILTTGATASECARTLLTAGAKEVKLATLAVASHNKSR
jgi:ComF family protein